MDTSDRERIIHVLVDLIELCERLMEDDHHGPWPEDIANEFLADARTLLDDIKKGYV